MKLLAARNPHRPPSLRSLSVPRYAYDWARIRAELLPTKSEQQLFHRKKNRVAGNAPDNCVKVGGGTGSLEWVNCWLVDMGEHWLVDMGEHWLVDIGELLASSGGVNAKAPDSRLEMLHACGRLASTASNDAVAAMRPLTCGHIWLSWPQDVVRTITQPLKADEITLLHHLLDL